MAVKRNNALAFIFITILIDVIGMGVIIPVIPKLIETLEGSNLSEAAETGGWLMFAYAIMQFLFSPVLGGLSDRFGRRPVLLLSLFGLFIDYLFMAWAPTIVWLFVGRIIAGIAGASFTTATAYIADISEPEKRAQNFGLIGAAFGVGFIVGPLIGGVCAQWGERVPFIVAAIITLLNCIYGFFVLPESLPKEKRRAFDWSRANPVGSLVHLKRYPLVAGLVVPLVLLFIAAHSVQSVWTYFTMYRFEWDEAMVGYSLAFVGVIVAIVQGGLIRVIVPKVGDKNAVYYGLLLSAVSLVLFGIATQGWMMFAILIPYALGGICGPALQGIMSNAVPDNEQGELHGAITGLESLTMIVGPLMMNGLFSFATDDNTPLHFPGLPFIAGALLTIASIIFTVKPLSKFIIPSRAKTLKPEAGNVKPGT